MQILLISPFNSGSHQQWAEGYQQHSQHEVQLLTLPGKFWKWRMAGGAVELANQFLKSDFQPDLILATDMLDLPTFLSLTREKSAGIPTAIYFHENQITYPWSPTDEDVPLKRDHHYGFMNYTSALAADKVFFNSEFHKQSFLTTLPSFLRKFPDFKGLENVDRIATKSEVLYLGMDLKRLSMVARFGTVPPLPSEPEQVVGRLEVVLSQERTPPALLWNHRWEYDKNPETFFKTLFKLAEEKINFQLIVLGESYKNSPPIFAKAKEKLKDKILHWGYAETFDEYKKWLHRADILPVTSNQDFFGGSVVEAIYCGCHPILPNRLAFPEHIPQKFQSEMLYDTEEEFYKKLKSAIRKFPQFSVVNDFVARYDWSTFAPIYDESLSNIINKHT